MIVPFRISSRLLAFVIFVFLSSLSRAEIQPAKDAPQPLSPEQSAARIQLPEGFRLELIASEPIVEEPSCIAFDEWGRLFVCELHGYNIEGHIDTEQLNQTGVLDKQVRRIRWELQGGEIAEKAKARQYGVLKLLSDRDGDGRMDHAEIWADDLPPCYGVVPARGGVLVTCAPDIIYFADRDGDGKPDVRQTLFTGFDIHVLERGINNPRWGPDNWIYVGSGGDGGTITGPHLKAPVKLGSSDFRIKPDGSAIEPVNGRVGTFGMTMNAVGHRFPSSGGQPAIYALPLPYHYLKRNPFVATPRSNHTAAGHNRGYRISKPHPWRVRRGQDPAWVKFYGSHETTSIYFSGGCSTTYYGDPLFPPRFRGNLFYCEPSLNIVHRCLLHRDGPGYRAERASDEQTSEFLASTDQWFRPMNLRAGPHGALHIVDMYREIIEDYSAIPRFLQQQYGLDKGHAHGRLWRLLPEDARLEPRPVNLAGRSSTDLAHATGSPIAWRRHTAQRLLVERQDLGGNAILRQRLRDASASAEAMIHALYTLAGLESLAPADVLPALEHADYGVRLHALKQAAPRLEGPASESLLSRVLSLSADPDPSVRLQLAMTLGEAPGPEVTETLRILARNHGTDRWMDAAILSSSNHHQVGDLLLGVMDDASSSQGSASLVTPLAKTFASRDDSTLSDVLPKIVEFEKKTQHACLEGLIAGLSSRSSPLPGALESWTSLVPLLEGDGEGVVPALVVELAAALDIMESNDIVDGYFDRAATEALDETAETGSREEALKLLTHAPLPRLIPVAQSMLDARHPPVLQLAAIAALGAKEDPTVSAVLLNNWARLSPLTRKAVLSQILARENRLPALLSALKEGTVKPSEIREVDREKLISSRDAEIAREAQGVFEDGQAADHDLEERLARYQKALSGPRDLQSGEAVFGQNCLLCHQLGDQGTDIGPSLGSITTKPDETILVDLLDPSSKIDPEYTLYIVSTNQGQSFAGLLASESPTSLTMRQADGSTAVVLRRDIASMTTSSISLMPGNLHEAMTPEDVANLIAFLRKAYGAQPDASK